MDWGGLVKRDFWMEDYGGMVLGIGFEKMIKTKEMIKT